MRVSHLASESADQSHQLRGMRSTLKSKYDVVVIGAGVAGLTTGLYLAQAGLNVLILEKHWVVGGCAGSFQRKGFYFDVGAHYLSSCREGGLVHRLLKDHDLLGKLELLRPDPSDHLFIPPHSIVLRPGFEGVIKAFEDGFGQDARGIKELLTYIWKTPPEQLFLKLRDSTFQTLALAFGVSKGPYAALDLLLIGNLGVSAARAAAISGAFLFREFILDGGYYPRGGMQRFSDCLADRFRGYGGDLCLATEVNGLQVNGDGAVRVHLSAIRNRPISNGVDILATAIVATCDPIRLTDWMLTEPSSSVLRKGWSPTVSGFSLHIGLREKVDNRALFQGSLWYYPREAVHQLDDECREGTVADGDGFIFCNAPSFHDPQLAPAGKDGLHCIVAVPYRDGQYWDNRREEFAKTVIGRLRRFIPDIDRAIEMQLIATPQTFMKYTGNYQGAMYGWESIPPQIGLRRFGDRLADRIFLAGHWAGPVGAANYGGIPMVVFSATSAARRVRSFLSKRKPHH